MLATQLPATIPTSDLIPSGSSHRSDDVDMADEDEENVPPMLEGEEEGEEGEEGDSEEEDEDEEDDEDEEEDEDDAGSEDLVCLSTHNCLDHAEGCRKAMKNSDGSQAVKLLRPPPNFCRSKPNPGNLPKLVLLPYPPTHPPQRKAKQSTPSYPRRRDPAGDPHPRKIIDRLRRHYRLSGWKGL